MSRETFNPAILSKHMHLSNMFAAVCSRATGPEQAFVLANKRTKLNNMDYNSAWGWKPTKESASFARTH